MVQLWGTPAGVNSSNVKAVFELAKVLFVYTNGSDSSKLVSAVHRSVLV